MTSSCRTPLTGPRGASAAGPDAACDLGGEFGVGQEFVDECAEDLLSGNTGDSQTVGGFSLPDVEGSVCGGWEVDGSSCSLSASSLVELLSQVHQALGRPGGVRGCGCAEPSSAGGGATGGNAHRGDPSLAEISTSVFAPIRDFAVPAYAVVADSAMSRA